MRHETKSWTFDGSIIVECYDTLFVTLAGFARTWPRENKIAAKAGDVHYDLRVWP
jgi:hypothetical protein